MKATNIIDRDCGLCGGRLEDRDGVGPCKICWTIQVAHAHISEQVAQTLQVISEYRHSLEVKIICRGAIGDGTTDDTVTVQRVLNKELFSAREILREDYFQELKSLRSLRARQRELRMKLDLRLDLKKV